MTDVGVNRAVDDEPAHPAAVSLPLPGWMLAELATVEPLADDHARMGLVLGLARSNVEHETGGPFAAALFSREDGRLLAAGVNLVLATRAPVAHAEIVAIALAGARLGTHAIGEQRSVELVTSCQPCAMCLGAMPWAGVTRLVCGARDEDARSIGFDEGDKPAGWVDRLTERGIEVVLDVRRDEVVGVLRSYAQAGGPIYNGANDDSGPGPTAGRP